MSRRPSSAFSLSWRSPASAAVRKARSPRVPAGGLGPHRPAGRSHRRRHCRPLPRPPGGRPPGDRGPPAHLDHGPAPEPGRGEHGSPLAGLGELRPPPGSARQHLLRVAAGRHRPHGVPPARPRSPSRLPLPFRHRCRRLPQLRTGVAGHRGGGPGGLLHRRHDASGGADLAGTPRASPGRERSELRHGGLRARAGAARAEGIRAGAPRRAESWSGSSPATTWWTRRGSRASSATARLPLPRAGMEVQARDRALRPALPDEPVPGSVRAPRRSTARPGGPAVISECRGLQRGGSHRLPGHTACLRPWPLHRSRGRPRAAVCVPSSLPEPADALPATARGIAGMGAHPPVVPGDAPAGSGAGRRARRPVHPVQGPGLPSAAGGLLSRLRSCGPSFGSPWAANRRRGWSS